MKIAFICMSFAVVMQSLTVILLINKKRYYESKATFAIAALKSISKETIYTYDDGNEGPYIKLRAKYTALDALRELEP